MIKPTVGRVVLFRPTEEERDDIRHAAIVTMVHSDECVNLVVFDCNGVPYHRQTVLLMQDEVLACPAGACEWMPYQKGQATKTDLVEELFEQVVKLGGEVDALTEQFNILQEPAPAREYTDASNAPPPNEEISTEDEVVTTDDLVTEPEFTGAEPDLRDEEEEQPITARQEEQPITADEAGETAAKA